MTTVRGRRPLLPSPAAPGPEAVPAVVRSYGRCADEALFDLFDAAMDGVAVEEAKSVCRACPALRACLAYAVRNEAHGVWGGMTPVERRRLTTADVIFTPEERRRAEELRVELRSGRTQQQIALDLGVNVRTLARWVASDSEYAAPAA